MDLNLKVIVNRDLKYVFIDQDLIILGRQEKQYFSLNEVGTKIWCLLQTQTHSVYELSEKIFQTYEVSKAQCQIDIIKFIKEMMQHQLILKVH